MNPNVYSNSFLAQATTMAFIIKKYTPELKEVWNAFLTTAKNATFLLNRDYMDYHSDRFHDCSLMVYNDDKLYALLPANVQNNVLYSHQGLTYGGLITNTHATADGVCQVFNTINAYLKSQGVVKVVYKPIPWIYQVTPAEEDLYALINVCGASVKSRNISSTINMRQPLKWRRIRLCGANKALNDGIEVRETEDFATFWQILEENLMLTYQAHPVHTLSEILLLKDRFPQQIRLYAAFQGDEMLGGTLLYVSQQVAHTQYISANQQGKCKHVLDLLFKKLIQEDYKDIPYFDFGTSNEQQGRVLNTSLIYQKEGFGGRGVCYDCYEWEV